MNQVKKILNVSSFISIFVAFLFMELFYLLKINFAITLIQSVQTVDDPETALVYFYNLINYFFNLLTRTVCLIVSIVYLIKSFILKENITLFFNKNVAKVINTLVGFYFAMHFLTFAINFNFSEHIDVFNAILCFGAFIIGIVAASFIRSRKKNFIHITCLLIFFVAYIIAQLVYSYTPLIIDGWMIIISYLLLIAVSVLLLIYNILFFKNDIKEEQLLQVTKTNETENYINNVSEDKSSLLDAKFKELEKLHQEGLLTDEEYSKAKAEAIRKYL